ncbi:LppU/SCO3897 family protein [Plantactinospora sp. WMMC1484]|uniref:LppU/SCO3897 family protein n=1 Tax=Plantactinospora sp. WMMC1484 TaxID=3404122 RepID=UPI003BF5E7C6
MLLLLLCTCLGGVLWWVIDQSGDDSGPDIGAPGPARSTPAAPSRRPTTPSGSSERYVKGDCLVNDGTDDDPEVRKVPCGPNTYEVLSRIPFSTDRNDCKDDPIFGAPESDASYVHDDSLDLGDYVLCLKRR